MRSTRLILLGADSSSPLTEISGPYRPYDRMMPWGVEDTEPVQILVALRQTGVRAHGVEIDLGQPEGPRTLFTQVREWFSRIDILVNNAAYSTGM